MPIFHPADIIAALIILSCTILITLGHDGNLILILLGVGLAYGVIAIPRPFDK